MFKRLTDWTVSLGQRKAAQYWLAFICFVESSVFPIPADVLFLPMVAIRPDRAWRYAFIASLFSVLGGIAGWLIGVYAYEAVAKPVLEFYGKYEEFEALRSNATASLLFLLLITSGLTHLPPMKVVTILAGVMGINIWVFIFSAIVARSGRFYLLAWLVKKYGGVIIDFVSRRLKLLLAVLCSVLIAAFVSYLWWSS